MSEQKRNPLESLRTTSMYFTPGEPGYIPGSLNRKERKSDHEVFMYIRNGVKELKSGRPFGKPIQLDARQTEIVLARLKWDKVEIGQPIEYSTETIEDKPKQGSETFKLSEGLYFRITYGTQDDGEEGFSQSVFPEGGLLSGEKPDQVASHHASLSNVGEASEIVRNYPRYNNREKEQTKSQSFLGKIFQHKREKIW
ncbi:MAG TPA: hypothetical protein VLH19_01255 [Patescibacteria group bacterium]|nr:hypothetical protein [Patescibacteria group bacterium]